jgi:hypothetical protein
MVQVITADGALRRALSSRLGSALPLAAEVRSDLTSGRRFAPSDILVIPAAELPPARCRALTQHGLHVVVLAAFPRRIDEQSYLDAGAEAYVPMTVDTAMLVGAIERISAVLPG